MPISPEPLPQPQRSQGLYPPSAYIVRCLTGRGESCNLLVVVVLRAKYAAVGNRLQVKPWDGLLGARASCPLLNPEAKSALRARTPALPGSLFRRSESEKSGGLSQTRPAPGRGAGQRTFSAPLPGACPPTPPSPTDPRACALGSVMSALRAWRLNRSRSGRPS